jgi:hypothetical protein
VVPRQPSKSKEGGKQRKEEENETMSVNVGIGFIAWIMSYVSL